ncbi:MAG: hypothetical protein ACJAVK_000558 [Akkermansiaceae bacterium]|jgi:hypothetical protein
MKARDLNRLNGVEWWEIDQAEEKKFVTTESRKPSTGRPSKWVMLPHDPKSSSFTASEKSPFRDCKNSPDARNVSKTHPTKLLPSRSSLGLRIRTKEWDFPFWYAMGDFGPGTGLFGFKRRAWTAYMKAYPSCYSKAAARSSEPSPQTPRGQSRHRVAIRQARKASKHPPLLRTECDRGMGHPPPTGKRTSKMGTLRSPATLDHSRPPSPRETPRP